MDTRPATRPERRLRPHRHHPPVSGHDRGGNRPPYRAAHRLLGYASSGIFDGWAASRGVDIEKLDVRRLTNLSYYFLMRNQNEQQRAQIEFELELPLGPHDEGIEGSGTEAEAWEKAFTGMQM